MVWNYINISFEQSIFKDLISLNDALSKNLLMSVAKLTDKNLDVICLRKSARVADSVEKKVDC